MDGLFKSITVCAFAKSHFINISLVYGKYFADLAVIYAIDPAKPMLCEHGPNNKDKGTTSTATYLLTYSLLRKTKYSRLNFPIK
jgi:hypothetical protein